MFPPDIKAELVDAAERAIQRVCREQLGRMRSPPKSEVDFVASFVESGASFIEDEWRGILGPRNIDVRVGGVFCHQSPKVNINGVFPSGVSTRICELADLLILHSHQRSDGRVFWRGVLMQAKSYVDRRVKPDQPQFWLYDNWPDFSIISPGFDRRWRNFNYDWRSGQYGLVSNAGWRILPPVDPLDTTSADCMDLSGFLVEMLYDMDPHQPDRASAHGRQVYDNSKKDWSQTIWDLFEKTAKIALRHKGRIHGQYDQDLSRLGGSILQMLPALGLGLDAPPPPRLPEGEEEDGSGVSSFLIKTSADKDRAED